MLRAGEIRKIVRCAISSLTPNGIAEMAIPSYLHWNRAVRWIIRQRLQLIANLLKQKDVRSFLDFGCGLGILCEEMANSCTEIYAADLFLGPARTLIRMRGLRNVQAVEVSRLDASIPKQSLDSVVAADVLEHVDDVVKYLTLFSRLLKPDGILCLSGPTENVIYKLCRAIVGFKGDYHVRNVYNIEDAIREMNWKQEGLIEIPAFSPLKLFRISIWQRPEVASNQSSHQSS